MRPRKRILCYNTDPTALSCLVLPLECAGYRALSSGAWQDAVAMFHEEHSLTLAIIDISDESGWGIGLVATLKTERPHRPVIALCTKAQVANGVSTVADAQLVTQWCPMADLLQRVKAMSARKRGPRKGWKLAPAIKPVSRVAEKVRRVA
jgi:two-component system, OmpR family, response regulator CpxR